MPDANGLLWVVGLDLSLTSTGMYTEDSSGDHHGAVIKTKKLRGIPRLNFIIEGIQKVENGSGRGSTPDLVVIEGYAMGRAPNMGRVFDIGELGGLVKTHYYNRGVPILIVPPTSLKMFAAGKGNADKEDMVKWAQTNGYQPKTDDDADAFALFRLGSSYLKGQPRSERRKKVFEGCSFIASEKIADVCKRP